MYRIALALLAPLVLTGCMLTPGKFQSELQLMAGGDFTFGYDGEIQVLALSNLADMASRAEEDFEPECFDEDFESRECTEEEIAQQRESWEEQAEARAAERAEKSEQMKAFLGEIDPSDPEAARQFAEMLERQRGWNSVEHKGNGLFDVDFRISGVLDHDFIFPIVESMPGVSPFVVAILRDGGQVRVEAPGLVVDNQQNPMAGMGNFGQLAALGNASEDAEPPELALPEGTFTIVTDGRILANNTDEGPSGPASRQVLSWDIDRSTATAPTALIALGD